MGNGSLGGLNVQEVGFGGARLPYSASSTDNLFLPPTSRLFFFFWLHWVFTELCGFFVAACEGFSLVVACRLLRQQKGFWCVGSAAILWLLWLQLTGLVAPRLDLSSPARGGIHVPCMGRQILHHWATRGALPHPLLRFSMRPRCGRPSALTLSRPPALPRLCQAVVPATGQSTGSSPWKT